MKRSVPGALNIYFCGREQCPPGHSFGPGVRPHYLIHFVLAGRGEFRKGDVRYPLKAGDAFLIRPMELVYYQADAGEPWEYIWVGFDGQGAKPLLERSCFRDSCVYRCAGEEKRELLAEQARALLTVFAQSGSGSLLLLGQLLKLLGTMQEAKLPQEEDVPVQYVNQALEYINNNYSYNIRIRDVAAFVGIDRTYLYRIFVEQEGLSPKQYLMELRIRTAVNMLTSTRLSMTEIAYSCGFRDAAAFSSQFKKRTGYTPKGFRALMETERAQGAAGQ